ncbi:MAG: S8 family serine peptidase [Sandaracinaceae bacterium]
MASWKVTPALQRAVEQTKSNEAAGAELQAAVRLPLQAPSSDRGRPNAQLNVYVQLDIGPEGRIVGPIDLGQAGTIDVIADAAIGTARLNEEQLEPLLDQESVLGVDLPEPMRRPLALRTTADEATEPVARAVADVAPHHGGEGVLIGVIDVDGFDFSHPDFLDANRNTRFFRIWDQAGTAGSPPTIHGRTAYGTELRRERLDKAIQMSEATGIAPYRLAPQSSTVPGSHGTHVASIAAGNRGVCPRADIAAVLIHLPTDQLDRRATFSDSTRLVDAIRYLLELQASEGYAAISINISLGTNGHAHDGTSAASRWIDSQLTRAGRSVCIAAGNAGQEASTSVDDLGFIMGRIHTSGRLKAGGLTHDVSFQVAGFPIEDVSENEIELWYDPQDRIALSVRPPDGRWTEIVEPGGTLRSVAVDRLGASLRTGIDVFSEVYRSENGSNRISIFLKPLPHDGRLGRVAPGIWTIRLHGRAIRSGRFNGWIERDDPVPVHGLGPQVAWHYPSFFVGQSNVDRHSISSLACTRTAVAVGNLDALGERIAVSSSQGPTRDGQPKPEVVAPGTGIVAACGFHPREPWCAMTGTSMASPYVAGVAGLMLAVEPRLTSAQIRGILVRTARPLPGSDYAWRDDSGYGEIQPERCLREVLELQRAMEGMA